MFAPCHVLFFIRIRRSRCVRLKARLEDIHPHYINNRFTVRPSVIDILTRYLQTALQQENANLKREYGLMTMAWYDLSSRVQSNTVMLQRRSETSKSWINKQRHVLNPTGRR